MSTPETTSLNDMTGKQLVTLALKNQPTPRVPWVPFVGVHAAALLGTTASDYLKSADRIVQGVQAGIDRYAADGIPVLFDLQLEAEVLGCELNWADDNPPSVVSHPLTDGVSLGELSVPTPEDGRIGTTLEATRQLREANPDVALYGLITGPFTLALHLQGTEIFMRMFDNPQHVHELLSFCEQVARAMSRYYIEAGCDVVAVVDPMTSQIGPDQFREFVLPYCKAIFSEVRERGALGSFFVCGHAQQNLVPMCECEPDNVSVDENIPLDLVREVCSEHKVSFGGNLQLTSTLLLGNVEQNERHALETMDIGGTTGYLLAPGCDLPYATPPENLEAIGRMVRDTYRQEMVRTLTDTTETGDLLDMSQYGNADKVIVDIITLDSEACAPCQYMVEAVRRAAPRFEGIVQWREHKIKQPESIMFMSSLMVKNIPTICIDGKITFVSRIPPEEELITAIQQRIIEKLKGRIRRRSSEMIVLGDPQDEKVAQTIAQVRQAVRELGLDVKVTIVDNPDEIQSFGVHPQQTPAIVTARYDLKSTQQTPDLVAMKEWIKAIQ